MRFLVTCIYYVYSSILIYSLVRKVSWDDNDIDNDDYDDKKENESDEENDDDEERYAPSGDSVECRLHSSSAKNTAANHIWQWDRVIM